MFLSRPVHEGLQLGSLADLRSAATDETCGRLRGPNKDRKQRWDAAARRPYITTRTCLNRHGDARPGEEEEGRDKARLL